MTNTNETKRRPDDNLPNWVRDSRTPQELIDQEWNPGRKSKYFKPPENEEESATYQERYSAWQAMWRKVEPKSQELDIASVVRSLQARIDSLERQISYSRASDPANNWPTMEGDM